MQIRDIFATKVQERIEPVVKVGDRTPLIVENELRSLIVTQQWENYISRILDAYVDAANREHEQGIGIWISGFFGSGKSLLLKVIGVLLEGGALGNSTVQDLFLARLPTNSPDRADIQRFLAASRLRLTTTTIGGNLHSMLADANDRLPLIVFRLFAEKRGYTHNWPFAWAIEYQIDQQGKSEAFRQRAMDLSGEEWAELAADPEYHLTTLYQAAADTLPTQFSDVAAVERSTMAIQQNGITDHRLIERLRRWCEHRDGRTTRHKLLIQLDELGQWINGGNPNDRIMQIQALSEGAAEQGGGRIWLAVTAHGDVQTLHQNVQQEHYAKIIQRFAIHAKLSNDDMQKVVEERVLQKTQEARELLEQRYQARSGELTDLGQVEHANRDYLLPNVETFPKTYPYLPWTVQVIPDVVKGIAQVANSNEALTGSNRTMIAVVQGALLDTPTLLQSSIGRLLSLAHLYQQLSADVPVETKTDLNRIGEMVRGANSFTVDVARGLFLLGQAGYVATTVPNVARTVIGSLDENFPALCRQVAQEMNRLVAARYVKVVGDLYTFLNTQQRTFQDEIREQAEQLLTQNYELSQALRTTYSADSALQIDRAPLQGRELTLRLDLDGHNLRNITSYVTISVFSPLQRAIDDKLADDTAMRQRSLNDDATIYLRMADVAGFRQALAQATATERVADAVTLRKGSDSPEATIARRAKSEDLPGLTGQVRRLLGQAIRQGVLFFRGITYQVAQADSASEGVRGTVSQILPTIYTRFHEVPQAITNDQAAVRAALHQNGNQQDLRTLGIFQADGSLYEGHPLLSALRARLPLAEKDQAPIAAHELRQEFERPPYGWNGHTVKVGLALLLQRSQCRLILDGKVINDPSDQEAESALALERNFRQVRVQGISGDLDVRELHAMRQTMTRLLGIANSTLLVPATLHAALGQALDQRLKEATELSEWARTAQCPLPQRLQTGITLANELLNNGNEARRLRRFQEQADILGEFATLLNHLKTFRRDHAALFQEIHNFQTAMEHVTVDLPELRTFLVDFRTLHTQGAITEDPRWQELVRSYQNAQAAITRQTAAWQAEVQQRLSGLNERLEAAVRNTGVVTAEVRNEASVLSTLYDDIRTQLAKGKLDFAAARRLVGDFERADREKEAQLRELNTRYRTAVPEGVTHLTWQGLLRGSVQVSEINELDAVFADIRQQVSGYLANGKKIIID